MLAQLFTVLSITLLAGRVAVSASPVPPPEMLAEIENSVTHGDDPVQAEPSHVSGNGLSQMVERQVERDTPDWMDPVTGMPYLEPVDTSNSDKRQVKRDTPDWMDPVTGMPYLEPVDTSNSDTTTVECPACEAMLEPV